MPWTQMEIAGKPADVFEVPGATPRFGLLFLPDFDGQSAAGRAGMEERLIPSRVACVCPSGGRSFWIDRITSEFDPALSGEQYLLNHVLPFFQLRWNLRPEAIATLGFGLGGQGALRLAFRHPHLFRVTAGIAPAIEFQELYYADTPLMEIYDSKEQCRQDAALMHIQPFHSPPHVYFCCDPSDLDWHRGNDRLHEKLNALGVEHTCDLETEAGGHTWNYFDRMIDRVLEFLLKGLEKESRRLI